MSRALLDRRTMTVGWWAQEELGDPVRALEGSLLRAELAERIPEANIKLVAAFKPQGSEPGFTGEPLAVWSSASHEEDGNGLGGLGCLIVPESSISAPPDMSAVAGVLDIPVIEVGAGLQPAVLVRRHFERPSLHARAACLRALDGLPPRYVLEMLSCESALSKTWSDALHGLASKLKCDRVELRGGSFSVDDSENLTGTAERARLRSDARHHAEDWDGRRLDPLKVTVTCGYDVAAVVSSATLVITDSASLLSMAWALDVPALGVGIDDVGPIRELAEEVGAQDEISSCPADLLPVLDVTTGRAPSGAFAILEKKVDENLDNVADAADELAGSDSQLGDRQAAGQDRSAELAELLELNAALRRRLADERLRFGKYAAKLEAAAAGTSRGEATSSQASSAESRRRLEHAEAEVRRLKGELDAIYATRMMRVLSPARQVYSKMRSSGR